MKLLNLLSHQQQVRKRQTVYRDLIRREAKIGGELFGPVVADHWREFFCLDERTWVWHEEWRDENGQIKSTTTRYEIEPNRIVKIQNGRYLPVDAVETRRLCEAADRYYRRVMSEVYPAFV